MTIARNIEVQDINWSNGTVGDGHLSRGHSDDSPSVPCDGALDNVSGNCTTQGITFNQNRTHTLSNGEVIWDFAGNIYERINWEITPANKAYIFANGAPASAWREFNLLDTNINNGDEMETIAWEATNPAYTSAQNIGQYYAGNSVSGGSALRGGRWNSVLGAGVFSLNLDSATAFTENYIGFRCAFHP